MVAAPVADKNNHKVDMLFANGGEGGIVGESLDNTRDSIGDAKTSQRRTTENQAAETRYSAEFGIKK